MPRLPSERLPGAAAGYPGGIDSLLEPRQRAEQAPVAVVQEASVHGVSTRRVDDLVKALGIRGVSRSQVSPLCQLLDEQVERFRTRPLHGRYPLVWTDATDLKVREAGRVVSMAVVIAVGVQASGQRELLGVDVGPREGGAFRLTILRSLVARGPRGVRLVTSAAHEDLKAAIAATVHGASWQRCRVHVVRNALTLVPKSAEELVSVSIRTVFFHPDAASNLERPRRIPDGFRERVPKLAVPMDDAEVLVLADLGAQRSCWRQVWSTNPLERLNQEVKRRSDAVGIFSNPKAVIRLAGMVMAESHDEWQTS